MPGASDRSPQMMISATDRLRELQETAHTPPSYQPSSPTVDEEAISRLEALIAREPTNVSGSLTLAARLDAAGRTGQAVPVVLTMLDHPLTEADRQEAHLDLARYYRTLGDFHKSAEHHKHAIDFGGDSATLRLALGDALHSLGELPAAVAEWHQASGSRSRWEQANWDDAQEKWFADVIQGRLANVACELDEPAVPAHTARPASERVGVTVDRVDRAAQIDDAIACQQAVSGATDMALESVIGRFDAAIEDAPDDIDLRCGYLCRLMERRDWLTELIGQEVEEALNRGSEDPWVHYLAATEHLTEGAEEAAAVELAEADRLLRVAAPAQIPDTRSTARPELETLRVQVACSRSLLRAGRGEVAEAKADLVITLQDAERAGDTELVTDVQECISAIEQMEGGALCAKT